VHGKVSNGETRVPPDRAKEGKVGKEKTKGVGGGTDLGDNKRLHRRGIILGRNVKVGVGRGGSQVPTRSGLREKK